MRGIASALNSLCPTAQWSLNGEELDGLEWHSGGVPRPSDEAIIAEAGRLVAEADATLPLRTAKQARAAEIELIKVTTVQGNTFDGDSPSQELMSRAITALDPGEETLWVLSDNTPTLISREELRSALRLAGAAQTAIWVKPYQQS